MIKNTIFIAILMEGVEPQSKLQFDENLKRFHLHLCQKLYLVSKFDLTGRVSFCITLKSHNIFMYYQSYIKQGRISNFGHLMQQVLQEMSPVRVGLLAPGRHLELVFSESLES